MGHERNFEAPPPEGETELSDSETLPVGPVPQDLPPVTGPQQYQVQFSTVEEHAQLVERAKALLARSRPGVTLGELHLEAMQLLVAALEKRRFAVSHRPRTCTKAPQDVQAAGADRPIPGKTRQRGDQTREAHASTHPRASQTRDAGGTTRQSGDQMPEAHAATRQRRGRTPEAHTTPRQRGKQRRETRQIMPERPETEASPKKRSRYIPAAERRAIYQRDAGRCTYVDARGERCCETRYLELHHLQPFAKQGAHVAANVTLRCAAHNSLAAEEDFGALHIAERRDATAHEALAAQAPPSPCAVGSS